MVDESAANATTRGREGRFDHVASYDDGAILVVSFVGGPAGDIFTEPCATNYEAEAVETDETIEIKVHELTPLDRSKLPSEYSCTSAGYDWALDIELDAPVGDREQPTWSLRR